jgi:hypothetical protein
LEIELKEKKCQSKLENKKVGYDFITLKLHPILSPIESIIHAHLQAYECWSNGYLIIPKSQHNNSKIPLMNEICTPRRLSLHF